MADEPGLFGDDESTPTGFFGDVAAAGERRGLGRPKGSRNKHGADFERLYYAKGYRDPALVLGEIASMDPRALQQLAYEDAVRRWGLETGKKKGPKPTGPSLLDVLDTIVDAADRLMPYLHGKKPTEVVLTDERLPTLIVVTDTNQLEEARQLFERRQALSAGSLMIEGEAVEKPGNAGVSEDGE